MTNGSITEGGRYLRVDRIPFSLPLTMIEAGDESDLAELDVSV